MRVLLHDDHEVFRVGLEQVVRRASDLRVVAGITVAACVDPAAQDQTADVALVSLHMPDALTVVRQLTAAGVGVVVLAPACSPDDLLAVLRAGARACLSTAVMSGRLLETIRSAAHGETTLGPEAAQALADHLATAGTRADGVVATGAVADAGLTDRQAAIAALVGEGLSNLSIARRLFLSEATVKSHVTAILRLLGLRDRTQLAIRLHREGVTTLPEPSAGRSESLGIPKTAVRKRWSGASFSPATTKSSVGQRYAAPG